jgi:hypothetical protein
MATSTDDEGAVLVFVLIAVLALSVIIGATLTNADVNLTNTTVTKSIRDKTYAADGGVEWAIQRFRQDSSLCPNPSSPWSGSTTLNGIAVNVTCAVTSGVASSVASWAIITTDTGALSLSTQSGGNALKVVNGPTYVAGGLTLQADLQVSGATLLEASPPCSGVPQPQGHLVGGTQSACTTLPVPTVSTTLPCLQSCSAGQQFTMPARGPGATYTLGTCSVFLPGKYTGLNLGTHNYFASGIYYFENAGTINVAGTDVFGGKPAASETTAVTQASPCATDAQVGVYDGTGVEWILGGSTAITVSNSANSSLELFSRVPGNSPNGPEGTAGISIRTVPASAPAGYVASTVTGASFIFDSGGGSKPQVAIHGLVYVPQSSVNVAKTNTAVSVMLGGVVAYDVALQTSNSVADGNLVSVQTTATHRFLAVTAVAQGTGGTKNVTTRALIELGDDAARTVTVDSWVTNQI